MWNGFAVSVCGSGHIRRGVPCQDASQVILSPRPAVIVCDGRGSAAHSELGAAGAVRAFRTQLAILE
ncbi:protein phosphatase 2C domain-containing protein, partial [Alistipes putredinis]|uniref:protein phosphatase 2C domain-containing protein n=1 Tax=Alistipes putredinis TaxID=28117 RepID=UPI003C2FC359